MRRGLLQIHRSKLRYLNQHCLGVSVDRAISFKRKNEQCANNNNNNALQKRTFLTDTIDIWGGSAFLINNLHDGLGVPYWACMGTTALLVRTALFPLVIHGAQTSAKLSTVTPEVQFLMSMYQRDQAKLRQMEADRVTRWEHTKLTFRNLRHIYKRYEVNPMAVLRAPLLQIPFFIYFATDIRKILNEGLNPELAQALETGGIGWFTDLSEPDPMFILPIISGALLYLNVEMAVGKQSLSGEAASKSNMALLMKDMFQTLSIFMPALASSSPAGVQIYLLTTFSFTLVQGMALRNDIFRKMINLPSLDAKPPEPKIAKSYTDKVKREQAQEQALRQTKGVLLNQEPEFVQVTPEVGGGVLQPGMTGAKVVEESRSERSSSSKEESRGALAYITDDVMEAANKGEKVDFRGPQPITIVQEEECVNDNKQISGADIMTKKRLKSIWKRNK